MILPPKPVIPLPPSAMAYVVHWNGGVMGVLPREGSSFQVLYPDGERTYWVASSPGSILEQLRENERFLSFERWLLEEHPLRRSASSPLRLFVSRAFLDETLGVVYIILTLGETTPRGPYEYICTVSEDEDLKPLREHLVLAKAIGEINGEVIIDPDSIWLLPRGSGEEEDPWSAGIPRREVPLDETKIVNLTVPPQLHVIHGFGDAPGELGDLRPFGFVVMRDPMAGRYRPLPMPSPSDQGDRTVTPPGKPPAGKIYFGTELYIWGLADWGPENLVLRFEPAAELGLAAYNAMTAEGIETAVALHKPNDDSVVTLHAFGSLSARETEMLYEEAQEAALMSYAEMTNAELLGKMAAVFDIYMRSSGIDPDFLVRAFLQLGLAEEEGEFDGLYQELLPKGLEKFAEKLKLIRGYDDSEAKATIRSLSHYSLVLARELGFRGVSGSHLGSKGVSVLTVGKAIKAFIDLLKTWAPVIADALTAIDIIKDWVENPGRKPDTIQMQEALEAVESRAWEIAYEHYWREIGYSYTEAREKADLAVLMFKSTYVDAVWGRGIANPRIDPTRISLNKALILFGLRGYTNDTGAYLELLEEISMICKHKWDLGGIITDREGSRHFPAIVYWRHTEKGSEGFRYMIAAVRHFPEGERALFFFDEISGITAMDFVSYWASKIFPQFQELEEQVKKAYGPSQAELHVIVFVLHDDLLINLAKRFSDDPEALMELIGRDYFEGERDEEGGWEKAPGLLYIVWEEESPRLGKMVRYIYIGKEENRPDPRTEKRIVLELAGYKEEEMEGIHFSEYVPHSGTDPHAMAVVLAGEIEEATGEDIWDGNPDDPPMPMAEGS